MSDIDETVVMAVDNLSRRVRSRSGWYLRRLPLARFLSSKDDERRNHLFRDVTFSLAPNEILAIVGPSGCGKTSLLRCLAGVDRPTSGSITCSQPSARTIMVWQDLALFDHLTVRANVEFGPKACGLEHSQVAQVADTELARFHLAEYAERSAATLSGGERQRLALARALAVKPDVLLLDEPFSSIDVVLRDEFRSLVRDIATRTSVILVTHDREDVFSLAHRVGFMDVRRPLALTTVKGLIESPPTVFAARFSGNFLVFEPGSNHLPRVVAVPYSSLELITSEFSAEDPTRFCVRLSCESAVPSVGHLPRRYSLRSDECDGRSIEIPASVRGVSVTSPNCLRWPRFDTLVPDGAGNLVRLIQYKGASDSTQAAEPSR